MAQQPPQSSQDLVAEKVRRIRSARTRARRSASYSTGREVARTSFDLLGIVLGLVGSLACLGFWYGSLLLLNVLNEVGERDFSGQVERIGVYASFFNSLAENGYTIKHENPKMDTSKGSSAKLYLWQVYPQGTEEFRVFRWRYDLETNLVEPLTNAALILDLELGFIKRHEAARYGFYDASDALAFAIARKDFSLAAPLAQGSEWERYTLLEGPVGAPLISPEEALHRRGMYLPEEPTEEELAAGEQPGTSDAVEVGGEAGAAGEGESGEAGGEGSGSGGATEVGGGEAGGEASSGDTGGEGQGDAGEGGAGTSGGAGGGNSGAAGGGSSNPESPDD